VNEPVLFRRQTHDSAASDFLKYEGKIFARWLGASCRCLLACGIVALRSDLVPENLGQALLSAVLQTRTML
jgi:hypothetical protein